MFREDWTFLRFILKHLHLKLYLMKWKDLFPGSTKYIKKILEAHVYDVAVESPLEDALNLSKRLKNRVLMKREDLQPVFSFKLRGAYNKLATLPEDTIKAGVICSSAGNHAQGVALAAQRRGVRAVIVMPVTTPSIKVDAVIALGGEVVLHGDTYDDAYHKARALEATEALTFIHPFDDPAVIAGQGTIGMEILRQHGPDIHAIFVPVGGGGLVAGISAYVKSLWPEIRVVGVEPEEAPSMHRALASNARVVLERVPHDGPAQIAEDELEELLDHGPQLARRLLAVHHRHLHVHEHRIIIVFFYSIDSLLPIGSQVNLQTGTLKNFPGYLLVNFIIFH